MLSRRKKKNMKRILCLVLTLLLSGLTNGSTVRIIAEDAGEYNLRIGYEVTNGSELPVGFGLDIRLSNGATFNSVVSSSTYFPIYPGSVIINPSGEITDYGTPIANASYPGTLGGIGTSGVTIEMGVMGNPIECCEHGYDPRDFNGDCLLDLQDLTLLAIHWLEEEMLFLDLNNDGIINLADYGIFVDGRYDAPPTTIRELLLFQLNGNGAETTVVTISENVIRGGIVSSQGMLDVILPDPFTVIVPEPATVLLLALGSLTLLRKRKNSH